MTINKAQINNAVKGIPTDVQVGQNSYKIQEQQANHIAMKATVQTTPGGAVAGFKVLGSDPIEGSITVDGPQVCVATDSVEGVKKTAAQTANINLLSRKAADGSLSVAVTQSTPDGMKKTMEATLKASPAAVSAIVKSSSPLPNTAVKAEKIDAKAELKKVNTDFAKKQTIKLKNPIGSTFANAAPGFSFANVIATVASIVTGGNPMQAVGQIINDTTSFATDPVSGQKVFTPIVQKSGSTNLSGTLTKGLPNNQQVKPTRSPFDMKKNYSEWLGWITIGMDTPSSVESSIYIFEKITSAEEWETDLINGLAAREITTMSIQWTQTPSDFDATISQIHQTSSNRQEKKYGRAALQANHKAYGLPINYIIKQDGSVHRGRPITIPVFDEDSRAGPIVSIALIAGSTEPFDNPDWKKYLSKASISSEQYKSLDIGIQTFLKLVPGGEFASGPEITGKANTGPGFDVRDYVRTKFNKDSVYDRDFDGVKSASDLAELPAATTVEVEDDPTENKSISDIKKNSEKFDQLDKDTGQLKAFSATDLSSKSLSFENAAGKIASGIGLQNNSILGNLVDVAKAVTKPITSLLSAEDKLTDDIKSAQGTRQDLLARGHKYIKDKGTYQ